ncbi:hypothetical protein LPJ56_004756 [Coemansia sp. RSA 2599]|nr:hypothetical protein LPJ56_004756 [Coemansia sp. RSA 2599]KAJ1818280.1 hypothetical protein LPJ75_001488 [Coemansia sp. RSA 2598]
MGLSYTAISYLAQISVPLEEAGFAAVVGHFLSIVGGMLGLVLYQACLKSRLIINMDPIFKSNIFLSSFDVRTMDIAALEMSGGSLENYVPQMMHQIGEKLVESLHTTFILSVPFLGFALLMTVLYKHHRNPSS